MISNNNIMSTTTDITEFTDNITDITDTIINVHLDTELARVKEVRRKNEIINFSRELLPPWFFLFC